MAGFLTQEYCAAVAVQMLRRDMALMSLGVLVFLLLILCIVSLRVALGGVGDCPWCPERQAELASRTDTGTQSRTDTLGN